MPWEHNTGLRASAQEDESCTLTMLNRNLFQTSTVHRPTSVKLFVIDFANGMTGNTPLPRPVV